MRSLAADLCLGIQGYSASRAGSTKTWAPFFCAMPLSLAPTAWSSQDCLTIAADAARMQCLEAHYRSTAETSQGKRTSNTPASDSKRQRRGTEAQSAPQPTAPTANNKEDVNAILNNLAGSHSQSALGSALADEEKAQRAFQAGRLINACATAYCQYRLAPYQAAVDRYRDDPNNPNKKEAESELRWQFRIHANPP